MKELAAILVCCILSLNTSAQKYFLFRGKVLDKDSRIGVPEANITFSENKTGCSSNQKGEFTFILDKLPMYMIISHIGYETRCIWIDDASKFITVLLEPSVTQLMEIEVKGTLTPEVFFRDHWFSVLDYELDQNRIFLLIYRFRLARAELLCKSENGDTLGRSGFLPFRPQSLFLDCLGRLHLLSADSAYEVYQAGDSLKIFKAVDLRRFQAVLQNCVASTEDYLYIRSESSDHQSVDFYQINRQTHRRHLLTSSNAELKLKMLRRNPGDYRYLVYARIPTDRKEFEEYSWIKKILYRSNSSTLHKTGDILCVFNSIECTIELYNSAGEFYAKLKMPVNEISQGKWTQEIYVDRITNVPYTSFLHSGEFILYRINLNSGELKPVLITSHIFPEKIRVSGNFVYYMYIPDNFGNKRLFRQKI